MDTIVKHGSPKAVYVAFVPGLRPVLKHGTHDQSSHGRRGGGSSLTLNAGVAQSIVERVRANGGLSVSMVDGSEPTKGFMVAKGGKQSAIVDADEFYDPVKGPEAMSSFLKGNRELSEGAYLGLWHNQADGKVYLDVSENIMDQGAAVSAGRKRDQISIWDVANFKEIDTGGTGQVGKTASGSETARPVEDDGWGDRRLRENLVGDVRKRGVVLAFAPGFRPVLKHGTHDQSSHGRWSSASSATSRLSPGAAGATSQSAADQLRSVPGQFTAPGGGTIETRSQAEEPGRRSVATPGIYETYEAQQEAVARALRSGDFSGLAIGPSRITQRLATGAANVEKRIQRIAERVGIRRKKRWKYTDEQATALRAAYYDRFGKPTWMDKAVAWVGKHLGGAHDQKAHGRGGGGWGDRQQEIDAMAGVGPSRSSLEAGAAGGIGDDEVADRVAEDFAEDIERDARTYVEEQVADEGQGDLSEEEFNQRLEDVRGDITTSYVVDHGDSYRQSANDDLQDTDAFDEVYGVVHTGVNRDGVEVTLSSSVAEVYVEYDGMIVSGAIYTKDGDYAGTFKRKFTKDGTNGELRVEHALLDLSPDYQGTGFSKAMNRQAENYYISRGIKGVDVNAALAVGGYAWAKQGFDWAPRGGATPSVMRKFDAVLRDSSLPSSVARSGTRLRDRLNLPSTDPDYPSPREVASWGYVSGASSWPGKAALLGSDWFGRKDLSPGGPRRSTTEEQGDQANQIPGQGSLFDVVS